MWLPVLRTCFPCWLHGSVCSASRPLLRRPVLREPSDHPSTSQRAPTRPRCPQCLAVPQLCSVLIPSSGSSVSPLGCELSQGRHLGLCALQCRVSGGASVCICYTTQHVCLSFYHQALQEPRGSSGHTYCPHFSHEEAEVESIHGQQLGRSARDPGSLTLRLVPLLHTLPGKSPQRPEVCAVSTGETAQGTAWLVTRILHLWEFSP